MDQKILNAIETENEIFFYINFSTEVAFEKFRFQNHQTILETIVRLNKLELFKKLYFEYEFDINYNGSDECLGLLYWIIFYQKFDFAYWLIDQNLLKPHNDIVFNIFALLQQERHQTKEIDNFMFKISHLININAISCYDKTAVMLIRYKDVSIYEFGIDLFIKHGGDINFQVPMTGNTLLHFYCLHGDIEMIQLLSYKGINASINKLNNEGQTPIMVALNHNHNDIVNLLSSLKNETPLNNIIEDSRYCWDVIELDYHLVSDYLKDKNNFIFFDKQENITCFNLNLLNILLNKNQRNNFYSDYCSIVLNEGGFRVYVHKNELNKINPLKTQKYLLIFNRKVVINDVTNLVYNILHYL